MPKPKKSEKPPKPEAKPKKAAVRKTAGDTVSKAESATVPPDGSPAPKKTKTPAPKPRAASKSTSPRAKRATRAAAKPTSQSPAITTEQIALRAYFIAERRQKMGWHGDSTSDWVEAERQLRQEAEEATS